MTRRRKDPLRPITLEERAWLERISRATSEPASHVARAKALLAVAAGQTYQAAAAAPAAAPMMPWRSWWRASTKLASMPSCRDTAVGRRPPLPAPSATVFSPRPAGCRIVKRMRMARQRGRSQRSSVPSAVLRCGAQGQHRDDLDRSA